MPTYQSTTVNEHTQSSLAVDGNYKCETYGSVSKTTDSDLDPFWVVNLEQVVLVREVKVTSRMYNFVRNSLNSLFLKEEKTAGVNVGVDGGSNVKLEMY